MAQTRPPKTLSIGGATFDLFVRTEKTLSSNDEDIHLPLGGKVKIDSVIETCGGGASNSSVGLARLGCNARFCGIVGSDQWGEKLLANLQKENVDTSSATIVEGETSSFSIILSVESRERVILYAPGTNAHLQEATFDLESAKSVDWIYLNHLSDEGCAIQDDLLAMLEKTESIPGLTWNPGGCQIENGIDAPHIRSLLGKTKLLLLNTEEAIAFTRAGTVEEAIKTLLTTGVSIVCITDGKNGTIGVTKEDSLRCPIDKTAAVIDTTGAGDAFGVGATWAMMHGETLPNILRAGTINAASVIGSFGAQAGLLTDIEIRHRLESTKLDVDTFPL